MKDKPRIITSHKPVNSGIVKLIEELLERAKTGEITNIAFGATCNNRNIITGYSVAGRRRLPYDLIGALEEIKLKIMNELIE